MAGGFYYPERVSDHSAGSRITAREVALVEHGADKVGHIGLADAVEALDGAVEGVDAVMVTPSRRSSIRSFSSRMEVYCGHILLGLGKLVGINLLRRARSAGRR